MLLCLSRNFRDKLVLVFQLLVLLCRTDLLVLGGVLQLSAAFLGLRKLLRLRLELFSPRLFFAISRILYVPYIFVVTAFSGFFKHY